MRHDHAATAVLERTPDASANLSAEAQGTVKPLNYVQLRLLAESAAGAVSPQGDTNDTNVPVRFLFRNTTETVNGAPVEKMELFRQGNDPSPESIEIVVPTLDEGRFPANTVQLEIIASTTPGGYSLPEPWIPDAVFWSDAAVQKFVFPYLTSCGGDEAASVLRKLQHAWNFYPNSVEVYGLIHLASSVPGEMLAMDQAFWVAFRYTRPGEVLQAVSLADFMKIIGDSRSFPGETSPAPVPFIRGAQGAGAPRPRYAALRAMAEYAASITDEAVYFVFPAAGTGGFQVYGQKAPELDRLDPADVVVPAFTPTVPAGRPVLNGVWFTAPKAEAGNLATRGDALFWSTAAIEQFVFPYYASKGGLNLETLTDLNDILTMWTEGTTPEGEPVYALIHLPHSEWTGVTTEQGVTTVDPADVVVEQDGGMVVLDVGGVKKGGAGKHEIKRVEPARQLGMVHLDRDGRPRTRSVARIMGHPH